jgi:hypothetical protein
MGLAERAGHMDVSNSVDVTDPVAVCAAVRAILGQCYPGFDFSSVEHLVADLERLYTGNYPGFRACDVDYHDLQHVLDVTLAMARLLDGYERSVQTGLGPELALAGIAAALFHDSGYIRRRRDTRHSNGAAYTRVHVERSARFLAEYLPGVGLGDLLGVCSRAVRYTAYDLSGMPFGGESPAEHRLGTLLGTADLIAQLSDVDYLRKCREHLYSEFEAGGIAGKGVGPGPHGVAYESPDHLLEATPDFIRGAIRDRLEDRFEGAYRFAAAHFGGENLYMQAIRWNSEKLEVQLARRFACSNPSA